MQTRTVVIPLGTGGGVVVGPYGDTNFAILPDVPEQEVLDLQHGPTEEADTVRFLSQYPYWLIDCGPLTAAWLCGAHGDQVTEELSSKMVKNLQGIIFTHAHTDHMGGLSMLLWRFIFVDQTRPTIVAHYECEAALRRMTDEIRYWNGAQLTKLLPEDSKALPKYRERFRPELDEFVQLRLLPAGEGLTLQRTHFPHTGEHVHLNVSLFRADHNIDGFPAFGVKVSTNQALLYFSGDTARPLPLRHLLYELPGITAVFHDCQTYSTDRETAVHCHINWLAEDVSDFALRQKVHLVHTRVRPDDCYGFKWSPRFHVLSF